MLVVSEGFVVAGDRVWGRKVGLLALMILHQTSINGMIQSLIE